MLKRNSDLFAQPRSGPRNQDLLSEVSEGGPYPTHLDLRGFLSFLRRRMAIIIGIGGIGSIAAFAYALQLAPAYTASAIVLLDPQQVQVLGTLEAQELIPSDARDAVALDTEVELVKSEPVALRVVDKLRDANLLEDLLNAEPSDPFAASIRGIMRSLPRASYEYLLGVDSNGHNPHNDNSIVSAAYELASSLDVDRVLRTYILSISYTASNPRLAAFVANGFAESYLDEHLEAKYNAAQRAADMLEMRVSNLRLRVQVAENAVEEFRLVSQGLTGLRDKSVAELRLRDLGREAAATRTLFEAFLARSTQVGEQKALQLPESRIVQSAPVPSTPTGPNRGLIAFVGALVSVGFGVVVSSLLEGVDQSVRSRGQLRSAGIRVLACVPRFHVRSASRAKSTRLRRKHLNSIVGHMLRAPLSAFSESVRSLRWAVRDADLGTECKVVMVTSALPGEGKTVISSCLAHCASALGEKVLLIDMDLRRPVLTSSYAPNSELGIMDLLSGVCEAKEVARVLSHPNLHFVPASRSFSAASIPQTRKLTDFLSWARENFDLVVIDTPPLLHAADGRGLISSVDGVVMVVQWGKTGIEAVAAAADHVWAFHDKIVGAALTRVDLRKARLYDPHSYGARHYYSERPDKETALRANPRGPTSSSKHGEAVRDL